MERLEEKVRNIVEEDSTKNLGSSEIFQSKHKDQHHISDRGDDEFVPLTKISGIRSSDITEDEKRGWLRRHVHVCEPPCEYIKSHDFQDGYACPLCGRYHAVYLRDDLLNMHADYHTKDSPFKCNHGCGLRPKPGGFLQTVSKFNEHFYKLSHLPNDLLPPVTEAQVAMVLRNLRERISEDPAIHLPPQKPHVGSNCPDYPGEHKSASSKNILNEEAQNTLKQDSSTEPKPLKLMNKVYEDSSEGMEPPSILPFQSASGGFDDYNQHGNLKSADSFEILNVEAQNTIQQDSSMDPEPLKLMNQLSENSSKGMEPPSILPGQSASGVVDDPDQDGKFYLSDSWEELIIEGQNTIKQDSSMDPEPLKLTNQVSEDSSEGMEPPSTLPSQSASGVINDPDQDGILYLADSWENLIIEALNSIQQDSSTDPEPLNNMDQGNEDSSEGTEPPSILPCQSASGVFYDTDHLGNLKSADSFEILNVEGQNTIQQDSSMEPEPQKLKNQVSEDYSEGMEPPSILPCQSASGVSDDPDHIENLKSADSFEILCVEEQSTIQQDTSMEPESLKVHQSENDFKNQTHERNNEKVVPLTDSQPGVSSSTTTEDSFYVWRGERGRVCTPTSESLSSCSNVIVGCECTICGPGHVVFLDEEVLTSHMDAHNKEDPLTCNKRCDIYYKYGVDKRVFTFYEHFHRAEHQQQILEKNSKTYTGKPFSQNDPGTCYLHKPSEKVTKQKADDSSRVEVHGVATEPGNGVVTEPGDGVVTGTGDGVGATNVIRERDV